MTRLAGSLLFCLLLFIAETTVIYADENSAVISDIGEVHVEEAPVPQPPFFVVGSLSTEDGGKSGEVKIDFQDEDSVLVKFNGDMFSASLRSKTLVRKAHIYNFAGEEITSAYDAILKFRERDDRDTAVLVLAIEEASVSVVEEQAKTLAPLSDDLSTLSSCEEDKSGAQAALSLVAALLAYVPGGQPFATLTALHTAMIGVMNCPKGLVSEWDKMKAIALSTYRSENYTDANRVFKAYSNAYRVTADSDSIMFLNQVIDMGYNVIMKAASSRTIGTLLAYETMELNIGLRLNVLSKLQKGTDDCKGTFKLLQIDFDRIEAIFEEAWGVWMSDYEGIKCATSCSSGCYPCVGLGCALSYRVSGFCDSTHKEYKISIPSSGNCEFWDCGSTSEWSMLTKLKIQASTIATTKAYEWLKVIKPQREAIESLKLSVNKKGANGLCGRD